VAGFLTNRLVGRQFAIFIEFEKGGVFRGLLIARRKWRFSARPPHSPQIHGERKSRIIRLSEIRLQEIWIVRTDLFEASNEVRQIAAGPSEAAPE
jgi:hypothetical protein